MLENSIVCFPANDAPWMQPGAPEVPQCEYCQKELNMDCVEYCDDACMALDSFAAARETLRVCVQDALNACDPVKAKARQEVLDAFVETVWGKGAVDQILKEAL